MSDDFKPLPTRTGTPLGNALERDMLDSVNGVGGIRKKFVTLPDGTTAMLHTQNGLARFSGATPRIVATEVIRPQLIEKDYALREYYTTVREGQLVKDLKKIILEEGDTPVTFEPVEANNVANNWYSFVTFKTADGIFDVVAPIAKRAMYGFEPNQQTMDFLPVKDYYTETGELVLGHLQLAFVGRTPVKTIGVSIDGVKYDLILKEPTHATNPLYAY